MPQRRTGVVAEGYSGEPGTSKVSYRDFVAYNLPLFRPNPERCAHDECASVLRTWDLAARGIQGDGLAAAPRRLEQCATRIMEN